MNRPFVDRPVVDRAATGAVARRYADLWDLGPLSVLRHGMNSSYLADGLVVRVGWSTAPAASAHALANWLWECGVPTIRPVDGLVADVDGMAVTVWEFVPDSGREPDWRSVGEIVRHVHSLDPAAVPSGYPVPSPTAFPWWDFDAMIDEVGELIDRRAMDGLVSVIERNRGWEAGVESDLVLCHGDIHPGNVVMSADGPVLMDWDLLCTANPAWDHAMLSTIAERWGGDSAVYSDFVTGYGRGAVDDDIVHRLGSLRNVAATLMRVGAGRNDEAARLEAERRLAYWRGESTQAWRAQ